MTPITLLTMEHDSRVGGVVTPGLQSKTRPRTKGRVLIYGSAGPRNIPRPSGV